MGTGTGFDTVDIYVFDTLNVFPITCDIYFATIGTPVQNVPLVHPHSFGLHCCFCKSFTLTSTPSAKRKGYSKTDTHAKREINLLFISLAFYLLPYSYLPQSHKHALFGQHSTSYCVLMFPSTQTSIAKVCLLFISNVSSSIRINVGFLFALYFIVRSTYIHLAAILLMEMLMRSFSSLPFHI